MLEATRTARPPWSGFPRHQKGPTYLRGRLDSLVIGGEGITTLERLTEWARHINFSELHSLEVSNTVHLDVLQALALMSVDGTLKRLCRIFFGVCSSGPEGLLRLDETSSRFLDHLLPLEELGITGHCGPKTFSAILQHGRSLHKLCLISSEDNQASMNSLTQIELILQLCPSLRSLALMIPRMKGNEQEIAIYRILGNFLHLKHLSLLLECSSQRWDDLNLGTPPPDLIRDILVNAAVDASLVRSIFYTISRANCSALSPLESLKIAVDTSTFIDVCNDYDFRNIVCWIGRSWLCRRRPRDDHGGEVTADEIGTRQRQQYEEFMDDNWKLSFGHGLVYETVWRELWPETTGKWLDDWSSFPLTV